MLKVGMFWQPGYRTSITLTSREEEVRANTYSNISDLREAIPKSNFNGLYLTRILCVCVIFLQTALYNVVSLAERPTNWAVYYV